jgi:hypothetical protein
MAKVYDEGINKITKLREDMRQYEAHRLLLRRRAGGDDHPRHEA